MDLILMTFTKKWAHIAMLSSDIAETTVMEDVFEYEDDCRSVKAVLRFTAMLLSNCIEKAIYRSTEVCIEFHARL